MAFYTPDAPSILGDVHNPAGPLLGVMVGDDVTRPRISADVLNGHPIVGQAVGRGAWISHGRRSLQQGQQF